jgi:hypothetical protein
MCFFAILPVRRLGVLMRGDSACISITYDPVRHEGRAEMRPLSGSYVVSSRSVGDRVLTANSPVAPNTGLERPVF